MVREEFEQFVYDEYGVLSENVFETSPSTAVFRHEENNKWFAIIMRIPTAKFGINDGRIIDVVNLKITAEARETIRNIGGIFPAYHMSKRHWISVFLDGSVDRETLRKLIDVSFNATI